MTAIQIPTTQTADGEMPVFVFPADADFPQAADPKVGDIVAVNSRGRFRAAKVVKVGPKRVKVAYTTQGAIDEATKIASIDYVAQSHASWAYSQREAERYREMADVTEREGIEVTEHREYPASKFVPMPAALKRFEKGRNAAGTTIVNSPETLRRWAEQSTGAEAQAKHEQRLAEAEREMKRSREDRVMTATHVTEKSVPREQVYAIESPASEEAGAPATEQVHVSELVDGELCETREGEVVAYRSPQTHGEQSNAQQVCGVGTHARRLLDQPRVEVAGEDGIRSERVIITERNLAGQCEREVEVERILEGGVERQTTVREVEYDTQTGRAVFDEMRAVEPERARGYVADVEERGLITPAAAVA